MRQAFQRIAAALRSQYTLAYRPPRPPDGSFRKIKIELVGAAGKGRKVRARAGYYSLANQPNGSSASEP